MNFGFGVQRMHGYQQLKFILSLRDDVFGVFTYKIEPSGVKPHKVEWYIDQIVNTNEMIDLQIELIKKAHATALQIYHGELMHDE